MDADVYADAKVYGDADADANTNAKAPYLTPSSGLRCNAEALQVLSYR